jgi:Putative auto-transporter adhesin, head GIN domain
MSKSSLLVPAGLLAVAAVAAVCLAQPARADTKSFSLSGFTEVAASAGVDVVLKQGPFSIVASGNKDDLARLDIQLEGSKLVVTHKSSISWFGHMERNVVTVTAPTWVGIAASSGSDIDADGLTLNDLRIAASGGADVRASGLTAKGLSVTVSGGADVKLSGSCSGLTVEASGGGDYKGGEMKCQTADVRASGGADADAWASTSAKGHASSGADIRFRGSPTNVDKESSSGGSVKSS